MATRLRKTGDEKFEADRWEAQQSARDERTLDVLNVLYVVKQLLADGRDVDAARVVAEYRAQQGTN